MFIALFVLFCGAGCLRSMYMLLCQCSRGAFVGKGFSVNEFTSQPRYCGGYKWMFDVITMPGFDCFLSAAVLVRGFVATVIWPKPEHFVY